MLLAMPRAEASMRKNTFPRDAIEATTARVRYGLDVSTYNKLALQLDTWSLGRAKFHSESALRRLIRVSACLEPSTARGASS